MCHVGPLPNHVWLAKNTNFQKSMQKPQIRTFWKKIFFGFDRGPIFFFTEIFLKKISGACPSRKNVHVSEKNVGSSDLKNMIVQVTIFLTVKKKINIYKKYTDTILNVQSIQPCFFYMFWCIIDYLMNQHWFQAPYRIQLYTCAKPVN